MEVSNALPNVVTWDFSMAFHYRCKTMAVRTLRRRMKRGIHKAERRQAKVDLRRGIEIQPLRPIEWGAILQRSAPLFKALI